MFRVPTYVAPSPIAGMGVFSARSIPAGTVIWEYTEGVDWSISPAEFDRFPEPYRSRLRHYAYLGDSGSLILCGDNAKFMNHDPSPNCDDSDPRFTITTRAIEVDEELTCDYAAFDLEAKTNGVAFTARE